MTGARALRTLICLLPSLGAAAQAGLDTVNPLSQIQAAYAKGDNALRVRLLGDAARLGGGDAVLWLSDMAERDSVLGSHAAVALGSVRSKTAAPELERLVLSAAPMIVRANALRSLASSGVSGNESVFASVMVEPEQPLRMRQEAALALGTSGQERAIETLSRTLDHLASEQTADGEQLRISIIKALSDLHDARARAAIERHSLRQLAPVERAFVSRALQSR